ncbi:MAG TPA: enoyl-CoA hydratase/isomerase family protein [Pyrinomonadaceae bacterium]|jgi:enoyl-CoA hydratase|nr:enoyl-CoA hydratase/isomerase family protein [Pyrinomonadaceae bacterium]
MAEDSAAIVTTLDGAIAVIRFNNPVQRNPLSISTLQQLESILSTLLPRTDITRVIFTGTDDVFASGANIQELSKLDSTSALQFSQLGQRIFQTIADATQITIAAISGFCMGGALDLALACDIRVASSNATFAHPGARLGIITGWGGTQRLPRIIGRGRALKLFLTAGSISSAEALQIGLVSSVVDDPLTIARSIARGTIA